MPSKQTVKGNKASESITVTSIDDVTAKDEHQERTIVGQNVETAGGHSSEIQYTTTDDEHTSQHALSEQAASGALMATSFPMTTSSPSRSSTSLATSDETPTTPSRSSSKRYGSLTSPESSMKKGRGTDAATAGSASGNSSKVGGSSKKGVIAVLNLTIAYDTPRSFYTEGPPPLITEEEDRVLEEEENRCIKGASSLDVTTVSSNAKGVKARTWSIEARKPIAAFLTTENTTLGLKLAIKDEGPLDCDGTSKPVPFPFDQWHGRDVALQQFNASAKHYEERDPVMAAELSLGGLPKVISDVIADRKGVDYTIAPLDIDDNEEVLKVWEGRVEDWKAIFTTYKHTLGVEVSPSTKWIAGHELNLYEVTIDDKNRAALMLYREYRWKHTRVPPASATPAERAARLGASASIGA